MSHEITPRETGRFAGNNWANTVGWAASEVGSAEGSEFLSIMLRGVASGEVPSDVRSTFDDAYRELLKRFGDDAQPREDFWEGFVQGVRTFVDEQETALGGRDVGAQ